MDQLDEWSVRGRLATAARRMRETLTRLATDSQEFVDALAEAERLRQGDQTAAPAGAVR
jgi:hypothetical protein